MTRDAVCRAHQLCLGTTNAAVRNAALQALAGLAPRFCEPEQASAMVQTMVQVRFFAYQNRLRSLPDCGWQLAECAVCRLHARVSGLVQTMVQVHSALAGFEQRGLYVEGPPAA